jgi:sigma-B regulation protein RsbU (phosphoserine phosphatase)
MARVLFVDDNPLVMAVYRSGLSMAGFAVQTASDGAAALAQAAAACPDAIVLDLMLPVLDGFEVLRRVRADASLTHVPVIVFSNSYTSERTNELWSAGATQVLAKATMTPRKLVEVLQAVIPSKP